ncbi:UNVERIFIED_CONTAM: hypothetical protein DQE83_26090 [Escherichia coli]
MINDIILILSLFFLLKHTMRLKFITLLLCLILFDFLFFIVIFGSGSWDIVKSSYAMAPFALSLIINVQVIFAYCFRNQGGYVVFLSSFIPPLLFFALDFNFIFLAHPLMMLYQYDEFYKFLPRFDINLVNIIIIYTVPFCFLLPSKKKIFIFLIVFLSFFSYWNIVAEQKKLGVKVLIVQTAMFVSQHDRITDLKNEIFKYKDADIIVFSESPIIGFKDGSRTAFSREFLGEIKNKRDGKLYIFNLYGFIDDERHNNNLSLYMMNGKSFFRYKSKLVPFWETPGLFYKESNWESPYFSIPFKNNEKYKFRNIYIDSYICYEAMFANFLNNFSDLTIIQSNYESFHKDYDRVVKNGNVLAYVNKSHSFKNFISVQNWGGTIFVDGSGRFHWDVYKKSKEKPVFLLEI